VLVQFRGSNPHFCIEETAKVLHGCPNLCNSIAEARDTLNEMIDAGLRYMWLETVIGTGISLALGIELSETYWTKFLPKTGRPFTLMKSRLQTQSMQVVMAEVAPLQRRIVDWLLVAMKRQA